MLSKIDIRNRQGNLLTLPFEDVDNGFIISEIGGLHPTKATISTSGVAGQDGAQFNSSKREPRDLSIKLDLEPDYAETSVRSLRQQLYGFFMPKAEVSLRLYEDLGSYVDIQGIVEDFDAPLFTQEPEATISIRCLDPDFYDPDPFTVSGLSVSGSTTTMTDVSYLGSVEGGFVFTMKPDRSATYFTLVQEVPSGTYQMEFAMDMLAGDEITISTVSGKKGVTLKRFNTLSSVVYGLSPVSKWLELAPGPENNQIRVNASSAGMPWTLQYVNRYGGL